MASEDYARATGSPRSIILDGREYQVSKFTPRDIGDLQAWLKDQVPDPRLEARKLMEGMPDAVAIEVWRTMAGEAQHWPPTISDDRSTDLLTCTTEGTARLLWVTLRRHNGVTLEEATKLAGNVSIDDLGEVMRLAGPESAAVPKATESQATTTNRGTNGSEPNSQRFTAGLSTKSTT
jgi:hypothetical protein